MATGFTINGINWDAAAFAQNEQVAARITKLYESAARELARMVGVAKIDPKKPFKLSQYPALKARVDKLLKQLSAQMQVVISNGTQQAWAMANAKNDALIDYMSRSTGIDKAILREKYNYGARNEAGLQAFQNRKTDGLGLSGRIWKHTKAAQKEIVSAIETTIEEGTPASKLSQLFRQALVEPTKRFKKGSKNWKSYHPGQGVYRSSYMNAMRVARTEVNSAYREADFQRWSQMDFVKGIEIQLSNNPHHCPVCIALAGRYPKDFKFIGWHPQCRCFAIPIMLSASEYDDYERTLLGGNDYTPKGNLTRPPSNFNNWLIENNSKIKRAKSKPYFVRDNYKYIGIRA